ncbi:hypothetical protein [Marinoscillum sp.]|uniref:hypothetical protein n=1 Tax=Marinoscillum sp. TaxID=2024838 RepID=UPI003BA92FA1
MPPIFGQCDELKKWNHDQTFSYSCSDANVWNYFSEEIKQNVDHPVKIRAIVETSGCLSNVQVFNDNESRTGKQLIPEILKMPLWKPGEQNGEKVRTQITMLYSPSVLDQE